MNTQKLIKSVLSLQNKGYSNVASQLTDLFGRKHSYLRISLTEKCNLRCRFSKIKLIIGYK